MTMKMIMIVVMVMDLREVEVVTGGEDWFTSTSCRWRSPLVILIGVVMMNVKEVEMVSVKDESIHCLLGQECFDWYWWWWWWWWWWSGDGYRQEGWIECFDKSGISLTRSLPHTVYNTVSVCASCTPNTVYNTVSVCASCTPNTVYNTVSLHRQNPGKQNVS